MNEIQIKSYLLPDNGRANIASISMVDEIRQFSLAFNGDATGVYGNLIETIKSVYGPSMINSDKLIRTYWQDEENELIGFSTDSDLKYGIIVQAAIKMSEKLEKNPSFFKVYIKQVSSLPSESLVHSKVTCGFCYSRIKDNRYKCTVCENYDLCLSCYNKNIHPQHSLTFIPEPVSTGGWNYFARRFNFIKTSENDASDNKKNCEIAKKKYPAINYK